MRAKSLIEDRRDMLIRAGVKPIKIRGVHPVADGDECPVGHSSDDSIAEAEGVGDGGVALGEEVDVKVELLDLCVIRRAEVMVRAVDRRGCRVCSYVRYGRAIGLATGLT